MNRRHNVDKSLAKRSFTPGYRAWLLCVVLLCSHAWADQATPPSNSTVSGDSNGLVTRVVEIFEAKCSQCHKPDSGKRPAIKRWADSRDLTELIKRYVEPDARTAEGYQDTSLWLILTDDPQRRMPPPKSIAGQLTPAQLETVGQWIAAGAPTQLSADIHGLQSTQYTADSEAGELSLFRRLQRWLGKLHPAAVHVPIGLLMAAAIAELMWWFTGRAPFDFACRFCTVVGAAGAIPAAAMGWMAGSFESGIGYTLWLHRWMGVSVAVLAVIAAGLSVMTSSPSANQPVTRSRIIMRCLVLILAVLVSVTGHFGGELVHGSDYFAW